MCRVILLLTGDMGHQRLDAHQRQPALRAARLQIVGGGQGSVSTREILAELPALAQEITRGTFEIDARPTPLTQVKQAWAEAAQTTQRIVLTPQS